MKEETVLVRCRLKWWLKLYVDAATFFCFVFGVELDEDKALPWIVKGLIVEVFVGGRWKVI